MRKMTLEIDGQLEQLISLAVGMMEKSYAPYSKYPVGAALLTAGGKIFCGCNVENAAYPLTICAERNAVFQAVAAGEHEYDMIVIATANGGAPCGACRQVMVEFAPEMRVITVDRQGSIFLDTTVAALIPNYFGPKSFEPQS